MNGRPERAPRIVDGFLVGLSLALAVAASAFALLGPTGQYEEWEAVREGAPPRENRVETGYTTLLGQIRSGEEDTAVLVALVLPIVIALVPLPPLRTRLDLLARAVAAFLLLGFAFVTGFPSGHFSLPGAVGLALAAAQGSRG